MQTTHWLSTDCLHSAGDRTHDVRYVRGRLADGRWLSRQMSGLATVGSTTVFSNIPRTEQFTRKQFARTMNGHNRNSDCGKSLRWNDRRAGRRAFQES